MQIAVTLAGNGKANMKCLNCGSRCAHRRVVTGELTDLLACYHLDMTQVEILFRYAAPPTEAVTFALGNMREVYGIRQLLFDRELRTLRVEYDATRLNAASVASLVRQAGLDIDAELPLIPPQPVPAPAPAA